MSRHGDQTRQVFSGAVALLLFGWLATAARAELLFAKPTFDAGQVRTGTPLSHAFAFVNKGPGPAEITGAQVSCGCLTPRLAKRAYQPGEVGSVLLEVNTLTQPSGPCHWHVDLACRCGEQSCETTLQLTAQMITEVSVQPSAMTILADSAIGGEVLLTDVRPNPLRITAVQASSSCLKAENLPADHENGGPQVQKVRLQVAPDCAVGRHDEILAIYTDDPAYPELKVPVTIVKRPRQRLVAMPDHASVTAAPGQAPAAAVLRIRDRESQPVTLAEVHADAAAVTCRWAQGPGSMVTVKIQVDRAKVEGGSLDTILYVKAVKPIEQELLIPVHCHLQ